MPSFLRRLGLWGAPPGASRSAEGIIYGLRGREKRKILWVGGSLRGKNYREGVLVGRGPRRPPPAPSPLRTRLRGRSPRSNAASLDGARFINSAFVREPRP